MLSANQRLTKLKQEKGIDPYTYNQGAYAKYGLTKSKIDDIRSRTLGKDGKVYRGEEGRRLLAKKLEKQAYYERNKGAKIYGH